MDGEGQADPQSQLLDEIFADDNNGVDDDYNSVLSSPASIGATSALSSPVRYDENTSFNFFEPTSPSSAPASPPLFMEELQTAVVGEIELKPAVKPEQEEKTVIWGTTVNIKETKDVFRNFLLTFPDPHSSDNTSPLYPRLFQQMKETESWELNIDSQYLWTFNPESYAQLINYPTEVIPILEFVVHELCSAQWPDIFATLMPPKIQIRLFNMREMKPMRELDPEDIDKLVSIRGMIIRTSNIIPELKEAFFSCLVCQHSETVLVTEQNGKFDEPKACANCKAKRSLQLVHNRCFFTDKQWVKLQETPDSIPEGETPHTVAMFCYNELVDVVRPGDRVTVTGIYRAAPLKNIAFQKTLKSVFKTYVDVIHFRKETTRMTEEAQSEQEFQVSFTESNVPDTILKEKEKKLIELSQSPDIYEKLTRSLAPSIWELDDVKKGLLCQLFGGTNKSFLQSGLGRFRGEINVLLCGDPGTSKSQLLQYVHKIAPRGIYTSGKGSSAVGLTAYIAKDPETRETVLESGALVLSDRGICCIDEFDKMGDHTRSILHEVMEQQTVSIAKAGIICTLNARTSILASANPRESRYNPRLSVVENIQLPPTLLSRFDLIYLVLDKPDERTDRRLAAHLVSLYYKDAESYRPDFLDMETLTSYISYAKRNIHPVLSDEAATDLAKGYADMRKLGAVGTKKTITATPRQLESLIRISEAHARMRFSKIVERVDVAEAIRLVRSAIQQAAIDPRTGTIDMDLITTGHSATSRTRLAELAKELKNLISSKIPALGSMKTDQLYRMMGEQSYVEIPMSEFKEALHALAEEEFLVVSAERNPSIRRLN